MQNREKFNELIETALQAGQDYWWQLAKPAEHYAQAPPITLDAGPYTLSFKVKPIVACFAFSFSATGRASLLMSTFFATWHRQLASALRAN